MAVLHGMDKLDAKLKKMTFTVRQKMLTKAAKAGAELIRADAASRAPRDSGKLSENMVITVARESTADTVLLKIGPSRDAFYGRFQEWGTINASQQPFLDPAFEARKEEALRLVAEQFKEAVESGK